MAPFISRLSVTNFGCVREASVELTPLHAFVGPNDSGKSTLLRAARTVVQFLGRGFWPGPTGPEPFDPGVPFVEGMSLDVIIAGSGNYGIRRKGGGINESTGAGPTGRLWNLAFSEVHSISDRIAAEEIARLFSVVRGGARLVRFDPDALRQPGHPVPENQPQVFADERGAGLPGVFDRLLNRGDDTFLRIIDDVRRLFPTIKTVRFTVNDQGAKEFEVELKSGARVPGRFLSEGLLYYLGFAAIPHLEPTPMLLVEEPENGLHPARIVEVVGLLREISKTTQVLIATHSPLVVNELQGDEVSVVTRHPERGTQVKRLSETPNFDERSRVYALGELWVSYANGDDEAPLLGTGPNGSAP